jgi:hypothetical protein
MSFISRKEHFIYDRETTRHLRSISFDQFRSQALTNADCEIVVSTKLGVHRKTGHKTFINQFDLIDPQTGTVIAFSLEALLQRSRVLVSDENQDGFNWIKYSSIVIATNRINSLCLANPHLSISYFSPDGKQYQLDKESEAEALASLRKEAITQGATTAFSF